MCNTGYGHSHVIGVLETIKLEMFRRLVIPINEQEKFDNGDLACYEK
jgi:hypothetical protein